MRFKVGDRVRIAFDIGAGAPGSGEGAIIGLQPVHVGMPQWYNVRIEGRQWGYREDALAPATIEYDPPKTRNGFMPGDRVRHVEGWTGRIAFTRHSLPDREWVHVDHPGQGGYSICACNLTLVSDDTGDPAPVRVKYNSLADIAKRSHDTARAKGFYDELEYARKTLEYGSPRILSFVENLWLLARCSLIHSEVSEMVEAIRDGSLKGSTVNGKPEGLPSEMADVIIRLADLAGGCGVDLDRAVAEKATYNAKRPRMHGGKKA